MSITFQCGQCGKQYTVGDQLAGKSVKCKNCGQPIRIPGAAAKSAAPSAKPAASRASSPPPDLDIYGLGEAATSKSAAAAAPAEEDMPSLPRPGAPPRPKTKEEKKAFEKRVKAKDDRKSSFTQPAFGISFGAVILCCLFAWNIYRRVVRPFRAIARVAAAGAERSGKHVRKVAGPITPPVFKDPGPGRVLQPGIRFHEITLGPPDSIPESPGHRGKLWLYLPDGQHEPK